MALLTNPNYIVCYRIVLYIKNGNDLFLVEEIELHRLPRFSYNAIQTIFTSSRSQHTKR